jgi:hypothetical protein
MSPQEYFMRVTLCFLTVLCLTIMPAAAQTPTSIPLAETFMSALGEGVTFQYPSGWYVQEAAEAIILADSEATYTQFSENPQATVQVGMVAISILRPRTLQLSFSLDETTTLDDFAALVETQLQGIEPEAITLGEIPTYRFELPPQRFESVAFAFESDGLYFATLAVATGTLPTYEPIARAIFASFTAVEREEVELPVIEVDDTLVSEPYEPLIAPFTLAYPTDWTISESEFGALELSNSEAESNVFEPPVSGVVRIQITFTKADELPFMITDADARAIVEFTAAADVAVLALDEPYGEVTEFRIGDYRAARMDAIAETSETLLMVVVVDEWFVTIRAVTFAHGMVDFEPYVMAVAASMILLVEPEATPEVTPQS